MTEYDYLRQAYIIAATSVDPSNQCGAVLVDELGVIIGQQPNKFPSGIVVTSELLNNRDKKLFYIEHAERNAIFEAVRKGKRVYGSSLYAGWVACDSCSRAIILCGVKNVYCHYPRMELTPDRWKKSIEAGIKMMIDCGVRITYICEYIPDCPTIIVNGKRWSPSTGKFAAGF